jgi:hypothetical protein
MNGAPLERRAGRTQPDASTKVPNFTPQHLSDKTYAAAFLTASLYEQEEVERHVCCKGRHKCEICSVRAVLRDVESGAVGSALTVDVASPEFANALRCAQRLLDKESARRRDEAEALLAQRILRGEVWAP